MKGADHAALVDRLARAMAWRQLADDQRQLIRERAGQLVDELEIEYDQVGVLGWMFVDTDTVEVDQ